MDLNLEKQLTFYGAYHHDPTNIAIHIICVPTILLTAFLFGTTSPTIVQLPDGLTIPYLPLNVGTISCLVYIALYVLLDPVAGALYAPLLLGGTALAKYLVGTYGSAVVYWGIGIHVASWIAQFVGHGKFEGRAPALLDNLFQAVFLAPFFVWIEILFYFGYRPELQVRLQKSVAIEVAKYRQSKGADVSLDTKK